MNYVDGNKVRVGDKVSISGKYEGVILANVTDQEFTDNHPKEKWGYLEKGLLVETCFAGIVHYREEDIVEDSIVLK